MYVHFILQLYIDKIIDFVLVYMSKFTYDLCTSLHDHWACVLLSTAWLEPFWWLDWWIRETKMNNYTF